MARAVFSPDGRFIATTHRLEQVLRSGQPGAKPHDVVVWNAATGELIKVLPRTRHEGVAFVDDGKSVLTLTLDGDLRVWPLDPIATAERMGVRELTDAEREYYEITKR